MDEVINLKIRDIELKFKTRSGVFSKQGLDNGTKLLLEQIKLEDRSVVADLGSGTGVVGILAAKLNDRAHIHLLDDHLRAVELAKENVELNNLKNVEVYLSDLFSAVQGRTYNQIFSNPPQQLGNEFLKELLRECFGHLKTKGILWLVIKRNLKNFMERSIKEVFGNFEIAAQNNGYIVLKVVKIK